MRRALLGPAAALASLLLVPVVALVAVPAAGPVAAASDPEAEVLPLTRALQVLGGLRLGRTVVARRPRFAVAAGTPVSLAWQWRRDDEPIPGATSRRHEIQPGDVGRRLSVAVTASSPGWADTLVIGQRRGRVEHRRDVRRTVTYAVETRGPITTSVRDFARLAQETYDDPRGWRAAGIRFRRVATGGSFTLVLAAAGEVPRFSSTCSSTYSCRVGRYVIINQDRWLTATPPWNAAGAGLRDYRHLVVDHESGHWLGLGHGGCARPGAPAPVMMQQSKGLDGCRFNPFPTLAELARVS